MTTIDTAPDDFKDLAPLNEEKVAPATVIGTIALNLALKYHDINTVQDGALYQQYKLEGRNMRDLQLDHVFETAIKMEAHLMGTSHRLAAMVLDAVVNGVEESEVGETPEAPLAAESQSP